MRKWMLGLLGLVLALTGVGVFFSFQMKRNEAPKEAPTPSSIPIVSNSQGAILKNPDLTTDKDGLSKVKAVIQTEEGRIVFRFYPHEAPKTSQRIIELIQKKFYDGLTFHRVIPGFVIQGGDPTATGAGGSGQRLDAEFNDHRHVEGTVAMARAADLNSADSQFYISLGVHPHLDRNYTVFGQVVEGLDIAKKIKAGDHMTTISLE
jgi:cyclophilin family peptidyl-prolyl cis-trans isomerase